jgi:hypothetical protein
MSITQYCNDRKEEWDTPRGLRDVLTKGNFVECQIPLAVEFKKAYDLAVELVGHDHFMILARTSFWFESDTLAIQYRLSL